MLEMVDYVFGSKNTYNKVLLQEKLQLAEKVKDCNLKYPIKRKYNWDVKRCHVPDTPKQRYLFKYERCNAR